MLRLQAKRCQLTIGQVMIAIAVCAIGLSSPKILIFAAALFIGWTLTISAIYSQIGRRVAEWCTLVVMILVLVALCQPAVVTNCRLSRAASPNPALQPTRPARTAPDQSTPMLGDPSR
jgi:hypothetical protein